MTFIYNGTTYASSALWPKRMVSEVGYDAARNMATERTGEL